MPCHAMPAAATGLRLKSGYVVRTLGLRVRRSARVGVCALHFHFIYQPTHACNFKGVLRVKSIVYRGGEPGKYCWEADILDVTRNAWAATRRGVSIDHFCM